VVGVSHEKSVVGSQTKGLAGLRLLYPRWGTTCESGGVIRSRRFE
jgi:hypothetical protein